MSQLTCWTKAIITRQLRHACLQIRHSNRRSRTWTKKCRPVPSLTWLKIQIISLLFVPDAVQHAINLGSSRALGHLRMPSRRKQKIRLCNSDKNDKRPQMLTSESSRQWYTRLLKKLYSSTAGTRRWSKKTQPDTSGSRSKKRMACYLSFPVNKSSRQICCKHEWERKNFISRTCKKVATWGRTTTKFKSCYSTLKESKSGTTPPRLPSPNSLAWPWVKYRSGTGTTERS